MPNVITILSIYILNYDPTKYSKAADRASVVNVHVVFTMPHLIGSQFSGK